jgi:PAS domain S-box-containing protein
MFGIKINNQDSNSKGESELLYRMVFENILEGLAYCQMIYENGKPVDFVYLKVNQSFEKLSGLKNVIGRNITEIIPDIKKTNPELFEIFGRVAETGKVEKFESYSQSFGGWLSVTVYSPKKSYFIAVFENITERKQNENALKDAELKYRTLFEGSPYGIIILDPDTTGFIEFNEQTCKQLGYTREEFAKLRVSDIEAVENLDETKVHMQKIIRDGRDDFETKHKTKSGEIRNIFVTAQAAKIKGKIVYHCIWRDITDEKQSEQKLQRAYDEAKRMLDMMTGRELKMIELKKEIETLKDELQKATNK